jgi:hypothetical protein
MTKIAANHVRNGDFLPGIDDGYVIDVQTTDVTNFTGRHNTSLGVKTVITFNDNDGEEDYLIMNPEGMVDVRPEDGSNPLDRTNEEE